MKNALNVVVVGLVVVVALLLGTSVVDSLGEGQDGIQIEQSEAVLLDGPGETVQIDDGEGFDETVYNSRGWAVNLTGADDSYLESSEPIDIAEDDTWTVSTWAHVDNGSEDSTMAAISANGRLVVTYNGTRNEWMAWFYDEGSRDSYTANVSAPNQPDNLTNVIVTNNGTHMTIYRDNNVGETVEITGDSLEDAPVESDNWNGRLDEFRSWDDVLNDSQRNTVVNEPIAPVRANRTARVMFDEPEKDSQLLFHAPGRIRTSNVTFSTGLAGSEMDPDALVSSGDYRWGEDGPTIEPTADGALAYAPVAYVDYDFEDALADVINAWSDLVSLAALVPMMALIAVIIAKVGQ